GCTSRATRHPTSTARPSRSTAASPRRCRIRGNRFSKRALTALLDVIARLVPGDPVFHGRPCLTRKAAAYWVPPVKPGDDSGGCDSIRSRHDDRTHVLILTTRFRPSYSINVSLSIKRAQGTPDAGRTREPCVHRECTLRRQATTGQPGQPA